MVGFGKVFHGLCISNLADDIIHDRRAHSRKVYLHDRPANRQRIKDGIYTRRSCELYKGIILHDRDVWNKQYTWVGATLQIDIGSYSSLSFGDSRMINPWYIEFTLYALKQKILHLLLFCYKVSNLTGFFIWGYMYPFTFIFGGTSKFLGVQCTL